MDSAKSTDQPPITVKLIKDKSHYTANMVAEVYICNIFEDIKTNYSVEFSLQLLRNELEEHIKRKPRTKEKLKAWKERYLSLLDEISRFTVLQSLGVESLPIVMEGNSLKGFREGVKTIIEKIE